MVIKTQEEIENLSAQEILDLTEEELKVLEQKRKDEIRRGSR